MYRYCTRHESVVPPYVQIEFVWFQGWLFWLGPTTGADLYCDRRSFLFGAELEKGPPPTGQLPQ